MHRLRTQPLPMRQQQCRGSVECCSNVPTQDLMIETNQTSVQIVSSNRRSGARDRSRARACEIKLELLLQA
jgi:hypothetical protein